MILVQPISRSDSANWNPLYFLEPKDSVSGFIFFSWIILFLFGAVAAVVAVIATALYLYELLFSSLGYFLAGAAICIGLAAAIYFGSFLLYKTKFSVPKYVVPTLLVLPIPATLLYIMWLEWHGPVYFVGWIAAYAIWCRLYYFSTYHFDDSSYTLRRIGMAAFRAVADLILLSAAGYGYVLMSQLYVLIWGSFNPGAIWIWEGLVRPLSRLPQLTWRVAVLITVSLTIVTLLNPRNEIVRKITGAVKIYKTSLAVIAILASFTFLSAKSIATLDHNLVLRYRASAGQPQPSKSSLQVVHYAAYLSVRLRSASPPERSELANDIARIDKSEDEISELALSDEIAEQVNNLDSFEFDDPGSPSQTDSESPPASGAGASEGSGCDAGPESAPIGFDRVYSECRRAVESILEEILNEEGIHRIHLGDPMLDSFVDALLGSALPIALERVVPEDLRSFSSARQWLSRHLKSISAIGVNVRPHDRNVILTEAGIQIPEISIFPTFHPWSVPEIGPEVEPPKLFEEPPRL